MYFFANIRLAQGVSYGDVTARLRYPRPVHPPPPCAPVALELRHRSAGGALRARIAEPDPKGYPKAVAPVASPTTPTRSARSRRVPEKLTTIGVSQQLLWPLLSGWASASHM